MRKYVKYTWKALAYAREILEISFYQLKIVKTKKHYDAQYNDTQYTYTQHNGANCNTVHKLLSA